VKRTEYLYGCSPKEWADLPYKEALKKRIEKARELKAKLVEKVYTTSQPKTEEEYEEWSKLSQREVAVQRAIEFNETLIKEIEDKYFNYP